MSSRTKHMIIELVFKTKYQVTPWFRFFIRTFPKISSVISLPTMQKKSLIYTSFLIPVNGVLTK